MKQFADLYFRLLECEGDTLKLKCIVNYLKNASEEDSEVTIWLLTGNKLPQVIPSASLKKWILSGSGIPDWLYEESFNIVKDTEETLSLISDPGIQRFTNSLRDWLKENIDPLRDLSTDEQRNFVLSKFFSFAQKERLLFLKFITGKIKLCADKKNVIKALSAFSKLDEEIITYRLTKYAYPEPGYCSKLFEVSDLDIANCRPYPFMSSCELPNDSTLQIDPHNWVAEWKWKGIRIQVVKRDGKSYIWSRSHEFLSDKFPDLVEDFSKLPDDVVLDGQLTSDSDPEAVQKRLSNKISLTLINRYPVRFIAFDILECETKDIRFKSLKERRTELEKIFSSASFNYSQPAGIISFDCFEDLNRIRSSMNNACAEGMLIKDSQSVYHQSSTSSGWYTLKKERCTLNAALLYIQRDYQSYEPGTSTIKIMTFGVSEGDSLVSVAKTDCNLSSQDLFELEKYIKENTTERVGPIRVLKPGLIFELSFDDVVYSKRTKSGINIISPQISSWKKELTINDIHSIDYLRNFISGS